LRLHRTIYPEVIFHFITSEVQRQGYDTATLEGFHRIVGMSQAWYFALEAPTVHPSEYMIKKMAHLIEPSKNHKHTYRICHVTVGGQVCPNPIEVPRLMRMWYESLQRYTPEEAYFNFQKIHPFADGNGRVGKIIHNWLNDSLEDPILVQDFFGHGVP